MLPLVVDPVDRTALVFGDRSLTYRGLSAAASRLAAELPAGGRVAVWALPTLETCVAVVAAVLAGAAAVPLNPRSGAAELAHIVGDSAPDLVLAPPGAELPEALHGLRRVDVDASPAPGAASPAPDAPPAPDTAPPRRLDVDASPAPDVSPAPDASRASATAPPHREVDEESTALIVYTSGTTGAPKGVLLPRRAVAATLDALALAWSWTDEDVLVHALPLFHVHGLVLGVLGPLRRGGTLHHTGRFEPSAVAAALRGGGTLLFGVPTMYHRLALAVGGDPELAGALAGARLLVSGSAALPLPDHERLTAATGHRVVERYGMSETLMNTSVRPGDGSAPGGVGTPLAGVELRLVEEDGTPLEPGDPEAVGEVQVRGPNLFTGYLNRPEATAEAMTADGWFRTGDMAVRAADGAVRLVGRKSTDLIKSGGYKIGAGEIENVLLAHPAVAEAAVTGEPDPDLGERVVAWVVPRGEAPSLEELADLVAAELAPHKRPRALRVVAALPRNDMGKILKRSLGA